MKRLAVALVAIIALTVLLGAVVWGSWNRHSPPPTPTPRSALPAATPDVAAIEGYLTASCAAFSPLRVDIPDEEVYEWIARIKDVLANLHELTPPRELSAYHSTLIRYLELLVEAVEEMGDTADWTSDLEGGPGEEIVAAILLHISVTEVAKQNNNAIADVLERLDCEWMAFS